MAAVPEGRRFLLLASALTLLALALRVSYFLGAQVEAPIRGDILEYWNYALNLVRFGVFSGADPLTGAPAPVDPPQLAELGLRLAGPPAAAGSLGAQVAKPAEGKSP